MAFHMENHDQPANANNPDANNVGWNLLNLTEQHPMSPPPKVVLAQGNLFEDLPVARMLPSEETLLQLEPALRGMIARGEISAGQAAVFRGNLHLGIGDAANVAGF